MISPSPRGARGEERNPDRGIAAPRVAIAHDWLIGMRGGERCLEGFLELLPTATVHTLFHEPGTVSKRIESHSIQASVLSRFRAARRRHRMLLPLYPFAMEQFETRDADRLLSLSHCAAKAAPKRDGARHTCYCFTPARYLWDLADDYLDRAGWLQRLGGQAWFDELRAWDRSTAAGVDRFIAISHHVADRIARHYGREAEVIYPPVEVDRFQIAPESEVSDAYLIVSALVEYKGVDLAIRALAKDPSRRLKIIGAGPMAERWQTLARDSGAGQNIEWLGRVDDAQVAYEMARCRAFILPCDEDFGITPLEAMAAGRPVVALRKGGALETVVPHGTSSPATGVFFSEPDPQALLEAFDQLEEGLEGFDPRALRARAREFDRPIFLEKIRRVLREEGISVEGSRSEEKDSRAGQRADSRASQSVAMSRLLNTRL